MSEGKYIVLTGRILDFFLQSELIQNLWIDSDSNAVSRNGTGRVTSIRLYESDFPHRSDVFTFIKLISEYNLVYDGYYTFKMPFIPGRFKSKPQISSENLKRIGTIRLLNLPNIFAEPSEKNPKYTNEILFEILDFLQFPKIWVDSYGKSHSLEENLSGFLYKNGILEYRIKKNPHWRGPRSERGRHEIYTPWEDNETGIYYIPKKHLPQSFPPFEPAINDGVYNNETRMASENVYTAMKRAGLGKKPVYKQKTRRNVRKDNRRTRKN